MIATTPLVSEFTMVGKLEDFVVNSSDRVKYLQLITDEGEYRLEVAKERKPILSQHLKVGCLLRVSGMQKLKLHRGEVEYKVYRIELLQLPTTQNIVTDRHKAKVLFCQKSNCWQHGGRQACELLKTELQNRGMTERVEIKTTGCLKKCQQAPNMVVLPEKIHYGRVQPKQIVALVDKHCSNIFKEPIV